MVNNNFKNKVRHRKKTFATVLFLLLFTVMAQAQSVTLSGTVTDTENLPLIGASVVVKGTNNGTVTDFDGNYTIAANQGDVLVFSYTGFTTTEATVGSGTTIDMQLAEDTQLLDEVVVIGYGTRRKANVTGAVSTVNQNYLEQQPSADATRALQGSASGVTVVASAQPGQTAQVRIRGLGTINGNNPLFVVDGVFGAPVPPPNQIQSIQVLKDATSTAIYGTRGANGVVLITTKAGKKNQKTKIELNVRTGVGTASSKYEFVTDPVQIGQMIWLEQTNDGITPNHPHFNFDPNNINATTVNDFLFPNGASEGDPSTDLSLYQVRDYPITRTNKAGTDYLDELYRTALLQDYGITVTGGTESTTYSVDANFFEEEGVLAYTSFNRYAFRANLDSQITDWLKVGNRMGTTYTERKGNTVAFNAIIETSPLIPIFDEGGNYAGGIVGGGLNDGPNPVGNNFRERKDLDNTLNANGNIYLQITPIKGLDVKSLFGYSMSWFGRRNPRFPDPENTNGTLGSTLSERRGTTLNWNWTNTISYNKTFNDKHKLDVLLGTEAVRFTTGRIDGSIEGFISTDDDFFFLGSGAENPAVDSFNTAWSLSSAFARAFYSFDDKYMLDATVRRDVSSRFGPQTPVGYFPAVSGGWVISNENFMENSSNWLSYLKLRAGWGESGNDNIRDDNAFTGFSSSMGNSFYGLGGDDGTIVQGVELSRFGNPDNKWETTTSTNIAVDATLFNKVNLTLDVWQKNTSDMLFPVAVPAVEGFARFASFNIGTMENKGIDLELSYNTQIGKDLNFNVSSTFTTYKNEVTKLSNVENEFITGRSLRSQTYTRAETGSQFPQFFGYVVDGIFQSQAEADAHPTNGTYNQPGNLIIRDVDGDGEITPDDRTFIGSPHPDFTVGLNLNLEYKQFDFSASLYASVGNENINYYNRFTRYGLFQGPKSADRLFRSWGSPFLENNADAVLPKASSQTSFEQNTHSDLVEDGSYLRLQNMQIGFNVPQNILDKIGFSKLRAYVQGSNLFVITNYSGLDPEVFTSDTTGNLGSEINKGFDTGTWPAPRQIIFGLNLSI